MILTEKDKFRKLSIIFPVLKASQADFIQEVIKLYPKDEENPLLRPFEAIGQYKVKKGSTITFEEWLLFVDEVTEESLIKNTAKVYLGIDNKKKIGELPMFQFVRLIEYAKDVAVYAGELWKTIKRQYTAEEIAAGIENMKSDHFDIIDSFCLRNGIKSVHEGYATEWMIIFRSFEKDFRRDEFNRRYSEVINKKHKK